MGRFFLFRYAWRNLWRAPVRTLLVLSLTAPVFLSLLMMLATADALDRQIERLSVGAGNLIEVRARASFGHVNQAGGLNRMVPGSIADEVVGIEHVTKVEPYLVAIEPIAGYYMTLHTGVRPGDARRLATHGEVGRIEIVAGRDLGPQDEGRDVALVGIEYARKFGITRENFRPGESVFIKDILRDGEPGVIKQGTRTIGGRPFHVVGLFTSGYTFGDNQLFLPYTTFQRHYGFTDRISKLFVSVDQVQNVSAVAEAIRTKYQGVDVATREDGARFMSRALATMQRIGGIWVGGMTALAAALLLFAMLLATDERLRELGTLKALGASRADIATAVLAESALLAGLAAALGGSLYAAFGAFLGRAFFGATLGVYLPGQYGESVLDNMTVSYDFSSTTALGLVAAAAVAAMLGSLYALFKAERLSPVEALRHE